MVDRPLGIIPPRAIRTLQDAAHRSLADLYALDAGNPVVIQLRRQDAEGTFAAIGDPIEVVLRYDNRQVDRIGGEDTETGFITGTVRAYAPWDVRMGDTFELAPGVTAIVTTPPPRERFGIIRAYWRADAGQE